MIPVAFLLEANRSKQRNKTASVLISQTFGNLFQDFPSSRCFVKAWKISFMVFYVVF